MYGCRIEGPGVVCDIHLAGKGTEQSVWLFPASYVCSLDALSCKRAALSSIEDDPTAIMWITGDSIVDCRLIDASLLSNSDGVRNTAGS